MRIDTILSNARITTLDPERPTANRVGILGGRVVGFDEELHGVVADEQLDLGGAPVVPGFNDAHLHFSMLGKEQVQLDLAFEQAPTLDALYARVEAWAAAKPEGAWVIGNGYDQNKIGAHPDRAVLDRIAGGRPVYLVHNSNHMAVANTEAFRRAGHADPDALEAPAGGSMVREGGRATGLLQEQAMQLVNHVLKPVPQEELVAALAAASEWALRNGVTSVTEPGIGGTLIGHGPADVRAFQLARERGLLRTRVTLMPYIDAIHDLGPLGDEVDGWGVDLGIRSGLGDEWLRIGPIKVVSDGSLIGRTAAMCCDYADTPGNAGYLQWQAEEIRRFILRGHENGWQLATHAIGDGALDVVLDAYEEAQRRMPRADARHRIEHVGVASDEQVRRIVAGGLVPVPQGRFVSALGDGFLAALGEERAQLAYRMRSFVDAGVELPGSTDAPVVPGEPLISLHDMVNRRSASGAPIGLHEALTPAQALRAYTVGSAYAVHEEARKGALSRGKLADLVVLSDDPLRVAPERIRELEVGATMVGGVFGFDAAGELARATAA
ncbi:amidohydrolase [Agromyces mediolanus]|uniref:amidohydrolase n=1 Tax=Agromyces mediolanus TaxID=41986 RepID=UPI001E48BA24|nr:amidohydrolase [Agromyces mediolanus]MCD1572475.1 amidohydrolase [Agromyces mediolanus]